MRALTLLQPWATLVALGVKQWETRAWRTSYRGPLAIHAGRRFEEGGPGDELAQTDFGKAALAGHHPLPCGAVIAIVQLVEIVSTDRASIALTPRELSLGNFTPGRWAWRLADPEPLPVPVPAKGRLYLWEWQWEP